MKLDITRQIKIYQPEFKGQKQEEFSVFQENVIFYKANNGEDNYIEFGFSENELLRECIHISDKEYKDSIILNEKVKIFEYQNPQNSKNITGKAFFYIDGMNFKVKVYNISHEDFIGIVKEIIKNYKKKQNYLKSLYKNNYHYYHLEEVKNEYGKVIENRIVENCNNLPRIDNINLVFTQEDGTYTGTDIIRYPYNIIHNELGIKKCRFYDLRRSYATKILKNGVEIRDVADILGHRNIETTENYYISSSNDSRKEANEVFERTTYSAVIDDIVQYKY